MPAADHSTPVHRCPCVVNERISCGAETCFHFGYREACAPCQNTGYVSPRKHAPPSSGFRYDPSRRCVECGCSDDQSCKGGCRWVSLTPPRCSSHRVIKRRQTAATRRADAMVQRVIPLRQAGQSLRKIGAALGISGQYVGQLLARKRR